MSALFEEKVLTVHHWTDRLFSFTTTRDPAFRFENGHFVMIGLPSNGKPLLRAYSLASPNFEETLEFLSIKVQDGPLTSRLQYIKPGDTILVGRKPTGTLLIQDLLPGKRLIMLATGTGLAPFMSLIRDPAVYERFDSVILAHGTRLVAELSYRDYIQQELPAHEFFGELIQGKLHYYPTVTREPFEHEGRVTTLLANGKLLEDLGMAPFNIESDRVMICGSMSMNKDARAMLVERGFVEGNHQTQGHFVLERAYVEQ